jgi:hypothetical protein
MAYSIEVLKGLRTDHDKVVHDIQSLMFEGLKQSEPLNSEEAKRQLRNGVGRRLHVMKKSVEQIFTLFPPAQQAPLQREVLTEVQIHLHAFVINLSGIFDNWAWAFLFRHGLNKEIDRRNVSLFKRETQRFLPTVLRDYLSSQLIAKWYRTYVKSYRDALAHGIPLYIPPAQWTRDDAKRYEELEKQKVECIKQGEWDRLDAVWAEQDSVGHSCPQFLYEFCGEQNSGPVYLHPQVLCDGMTVTEFGHKYYAAWDEHA